MIAVTRIERGWELPLVGFVAVGYEVGVWGADLLLNRGDERSMIRLGTEQADVVEGLALKSAVVARAHAADDATLEVDFGEHGVVVVPAGRFEAWEVSGPGRLLVVAPAGGGEPAIWDDTTPSTIVRLEDA